MADIKPDDVKKDDYYTILKVTPDAPSEVIDAAYGILIKGKYTLKERLKMDVAKEVLCDVDKRKTYDEKYIIKKEPKPVKKKEDLEDKCEEPIVNETLNPSQNKLRSIYLRVLDSDFFRSDWDEKPHYPKENYQEYSNWIKTGKTTKYQATEDTLFIGANKIFATLDYSSAGVELSDGTIFKIAHPKDSDPYRYQNLNLYIENPKIGSIIFMRATSAKSFWGLSMLSPGGSRDKIPFNQVYCQSILDKFKQFHKEVIDGDVKVLVGGK